MERSLNVRPNGTGGTWWAGDWVDRLPAPAAILRRNGEVERYNSEAEELLGWHGDTPERLGGPGVPWFERLLDALGQSGQHRTIITRRANGERRNIELRASVMEPDRILVLLTECPRPGAMRGRAGGERHLRSFLSSLPSPVMIEQDERIVYLNRVAAELIGRPEHTAVHQLTSDVVPEQVLALLRDPLSGNGTADSLMFEALFHGSETPHAIEISAVPLQYYGRPALQLMLRDVTERQRTEEQLRSSQEQLRHSQKLDAMGRLAAGVAHDFNNVLTAIQGHLQFLMQDLPEEGTARADALEIRHAADRATELTRQLLTFARKRGSAPRELDMNGVVAGLEKLLRRLLRPGIRLEAVLGSELPHVWADAGQLEQVIVNLVVNARDALSDGDGTIVLRTSGMKLTEPYRDRDLLLEPGSYVVLSVTDNGCGMSDAMRAQVFEPFFTTKVEGTGLGLATTYGIIKQAGGVISVYSEERIGTTFRVFLPAVDEDLISRDFDDEDQAETQVGETILLVEDDVAVRELARRALERAGFVVIEAGDGVGGLRAARNTNRIDVVVADMMLPGVRGDELAVLIWDAQPDAALVLISGFSEAPLLVDDALRKRALFLEKPFTPASLIATIRRAAERTTL